MARHDSSPPGGLHLWPADTCLVTELTRELDALDGETLRRTDLVLPTGRLGTWMIAMLARRRRAFIPPRCLTRDEFVSTHATALGLTSPATTLPLLTDLEEELLLAGLLKAGGYRHLRLGHEHEVRQLFNELIAWDLEDSAFARLGASIAADIYRSEQGLGSLQERVDELHDLADRYQERLQALAVTTPRRRLRGLSRALAAHLESGAPLLVDRLYMAGFTSMEQMHAPLLAALARRPEVQLWVTEPPTRDTADAETVAAGPVPLLLAMIDAPPTRRTPSLRRTPPPFLVNRTPSVLGETARALELVTEALQGGLQPSAVAILVTDDKTYGKALRALLPGCAFAANVALAAPLASTPAGTWLTALLDLVPGDPDMAELPRLLAFITHPLTPLRPSAAGDAATDASRAAPLTRERLVGELLGSGVPGGFAALAASPALSEPVRTALATVAALLAPLRPQLGQQPLAAWARRFASVVRPILLDTPRRPAGAAGRSGGSDGDIGVALSTTAALENFLAALAATAARMEVTDLLLTQSEFLALVGARLLAEEVRSVGDPLRGVQILSVEEARYVPFDLLVVLGAAEGQFPRAVPRDYLLDNFLKTRIGLPGWQLAEAIEDTTFALLRARLPALVLTYPETSGGEPVVRSRFIEAALVAGEAVETAIDPETTLLTRLTAAQVPAAERPEAGGEAPWRRHAATRNAPAGALGRARAAFASPMSASALEGLIRCPYRFLLSRLGVSDLAWVEEGDARAEGDWLHDVLEAFFTGKSGDQEVAPPLDSDVPWEEFRPYALDRLQLLTAALAPAHARGTQVDLHLRLKAWPAFVTHLMTVYDRGTLGEAGKGLREYRIGMGGDAATTSASAGDEAKVWVQVGKTRVALRGLIDAVDKLAGGHLITDYKRSYTPDKRAVMEGTAPQLPLYALALNALNGGEPEQRWPLRQAVVGYWSILGGTWEGIAAGSDVKTEAGRRRLVGTQGKTTLEDASAGLMDLWSWRHTALFEDDAPFSPDPSRCELCNLAGVCRRDDPEIGPTIAGGDALARRLAQRRARTSSPADDGESGGSR